MVSLKVYITLVPHVNKWMYSRIHTEHASLSGVDRLDAQKRVQDTSASQH